MEGRVSTIDTVREYHRTHCSTTIILKQAGGGRKMDKDRGNAPEGPKFEIPKMPKIKNEGQRELREGKAESDHEDETEKSSGCDGAGKKWEKEILGG